jgi:hypothetical protein
LYIIILRLIIPLLWIFLKNYGKNSSTRSKLYQGKRGTYGGGINNTTLFTVDRPMDSVVSNVKHSKDTGNGITWKIYDLSIDSF